MKDKIEVGYPLKMHDTDIAKIKNIPDRYLGEILIDAIHKYAPKDKYEFYEIIYFKILKRWREDKKALKCIDEYIEKRIKNFK